MTGGIRGEDLVLSRQFYQPIPVRVPLEKLAIDGLEFTLENANATFPRRGGDYAVLASLRQERNLEVLGKIAKVPRTRPGLLQQILPLAKFALEAHALGHPSCSCIKTWVNRRLYSTLRGDVHRRGGDIGGTKALGFILNPK
jgi:hypothetical protein